MPNTPKIVTRSETTSSNTVENLNKGSKLSFAEMDSNFLELRNGSIGIVGDDSTGIDLAQGSTLKVAGTGGISTTVSGDTLTVDASSIVTTSLGDLTAVGSTLQSPSNADITLEPGGTGAVNMGAIRIRDNHIEGTRSNDDIIIDPNGTGNILLNPAASTYGQVVIKGGGEDGLSVIHPQLKIVDEQGTELLFGDNWALASTGATIASGSGDILTLQGGNQDQTINARTPNFNIFSGTTGKLTLGQGAGSVSARHPGEITTAYNTADGQGFDLKLNTGSSSATTPGKLLVGTSAHNATITSNGAYNLNLETNSGTNSGQIQITAGANGIIYITPNQGGTGKVEIGNQSTVSTGDSGGGTVEVANIIMRDPGGLAGAGRHSFNAIEIPFSADGSTSSDMYIGLDGNADPYIHFNRAGDLTNGAKIKTLTGSMTIQTDGANSSAGNIRIQAAGDITLAPSGVLNLGSDTIVVSGNRMYTDQSNEDMELLANGAGNISLLSPANMNSNKIINVTDPTANQDAATKAYVDAQVLASGDTGDLTINGSTITAPSNADLTLTVAGTGQIVVDGTLTATEVISDLTGTIEFDAKATEAITKGEAVYIAGIDGNTPTVALARANASGTMPGFGIAAADIALNATGKITTFGSLTGLDAADFGETSITFSLGDTVYISSAEAGKLTNVAPTGESNFIQNIGKIERATPTTNITIKVGGAGRTNATPALNEGNIFIGNASNQSSTVALADQIRNYKAITVVGDDSTGTNVNIGETFKVAGTQNVSTAVSGDTLTITGPDLTSYLTAETNDLTSAVTWANVPDANITQSSVTQHQAALSLTESQITDLQSYITDANITIVGDDSTGVTFSAKNNDDITITGTGGITSTVSGNTITIDGSGVSGGAANTGDITFVGSTMSSPSNANFTIETAGTGKIILTGITFPDTDGTADQVLGTNGSGVLSFRDPTAINIDGGVADSVYTSVPTIDGGIA